MAAKPELVVLVIDVGSTMHPHLELAGRAAGDLLTEKMLHHPNDRVGLLLFGASETDNRENAKSALEPGGEQEYAHIVEAQGLAPPTVDHLRAVHSLPPGQGRSDFKEALAVAAAMLVADDTGPRLKRRIVLLSNLCGQLQEDPGDELAGWLAEGLQREDVFLDALLLDLPGEDVAHEPHKTQNLNQLATICQELAHRERHYRSAVDLLGAFPAHQVAARASATGTLDIGTKLKIKIKVAGKTMKEKFPPAGKETVQEEALPEGLEAGILRHKEYLYVDKEAHGDDPVPDAEVADAYRYGRNLVPVEEELAQFFQYPAEKGMKLLGFLPDDAVPRHMYMADVKLAVADKDAPASCLALAALTQAMHRQRQKAVVRFIARAGQKPELFLAAAVPAGASRAAHLLLNSLPFMEDMRDFRFPSFTKPNWTPSEQQLDAAAALVTSMDLGEGELEQLQPERTPDPALHRLYFECGRRALDPQAPLQEEDVLVEHVFEPHPERVPGAAEALAAAAAAFPMDLAARAQRRQGRVGLTAPREDYERLLAQGDVDGALTGLAAALLDIVFGSMGSSKFQLGVELVDTLRDGCCHANDPETFNSFLAEVEKRARQEPTKTEFWRWLCRREIKPISREEAGASQLDAAQTQEWYTQHSRE